MTHVTCRLTAKNRDQLRNPTLGNRVWATFTFIATRQRRALKVTPQVATGGGVCGLCRGVLVTAGARDADWCGDGRRRSSVGQLGWWHGQSVIHVLVLLDVAAALSRRHTAARRQYSRVTLGACFSAYYTVTTCLENLENLEMSEN